MTPFDDFNDLILETHAVYLSDANEQELIRRAFETDDVADLALRTCRCGARIDGFDAYADHIREVLASGG
ncbi:MAG: hypothetical protein ACC726_03190 [Chloroflexota bacterium]